MSEASEWWRLITNIPILVLEESIILVERYTQVFHKGHSTFTNFPYYVEHKCPPLYRTKSNFKVLGESTP